LVRRIPPTVPYGLRAVSGSSGTPLSCAREHTAPPTDLESSSEFCPTLKAWPRPGSSHEVRSPSSATGQEKLLAPGLPPPDTSAHRVSNPLGVLTPPLICSAVFHAEYAHGVPSHSPSAPDTCRNMIPKKWGVRCRTPHLGFCHGCLGRSVARGSLFCASSVCTPFRPPPSPGFPVRINTTSLKQHGLTGRQAAKSSSRDHGIYHASFGVAPAGSSASTMAWCTSRHDKTSCRSPLRPKVLLEAF
jgi:hypothetical protein